MIIILFLDDFLHEKSISIITPIDGKPFFLWTLESVLEKVSVSFIYIVASRMHKQLAKYCIDIPNVDIVSVINVSRFENEQVLCLSSVFFMPDTISLMKMITTDDQKKHHLFVTMVPSTCFIRVIDHKYTFSDSGEFGFAGAFFLQNPFISSSSEISCFQDLLNQFVILDIELFWTYRPVQTILTVNDLIHAQHQLLYKNMINVSKTIYHLLKKVSELEQRLSSLS